MAKVQYSVAVSDMRNKVGGAVYSKNRAGAIVRRKSSPTQPRTSTQMSVRSSFSYLSKRWANDLDPDQRAGWIALAASHPTTDVFGNTVTLTGLQLYQACNRALHTIGQAYIDDPPATLSAEDTGPLDVTVAAGTPAFTVEPASFNTSADGWVIFATPQLSAGRVSAQSKLSVIKAGVTVLAAAQSILTEYTAKFGALIEARNVLVGMVYIDKATGAMGLRVTQIAAVAA